LFFSAVVLALDPLPFASPVPDTTVVPDSATDIAPVRRPRLEPQYDVAVYTYRCSDCHRIIPSSEDTDRAPTQHKEIVLEHGINTRCFNCHHPTNRDAFVDDLGDEIPWNEPQLVCAKCHGPVYRDWQHGSHGRTNGYWDTSKGPQTRRKCIECHDPHRPPFPSMNPAPAPRTLRMGGQDHQQHTEEHDPLRLGGHAGTRAIVALEEGH
jgi:hypothetical protein